MSTPPPKIQKSRANSKISTKTPVLSFTEIRKQTLTFKQKHLDGKIISRKDKPGDILFSDFKTHCKGTVHQQCGRAVEQACADGANHSLFNQQWRKSELMGNRVKFTFIMWILQKSSSKISWKKPWKQTTQTVGHRRHYWRQTTGSPSNSFNFPATEEASQHGKSTGHPPSVGRCVCEPSLDQGYSVKHNRNISLMQ